MRLSEEEITARHVAGKLTGHLAGSDAVFRIPLTGPTDGTWAFSATVRYAILFGNGKLDLFFDKSDLIQANLNGHICELFDGVYEVGCVLTGEGDTIVSIKLVNSA